MNFWKKMLAFLFDGGRPEPWYMFEVGEWAFIKSPDGRSSGEMFHISKVHEASRACFCREPKPTGAERSSHEEFCEFRLVHPQMLFSKGPKVLWGHDLLSAYEPKKAEAILKQLLGAAHNELPIPANVATDIKLGEVGGYFGYESGRVDYSLSVDSGEENLEIEFVEHGKVIITLRGGQISRYHWFGRDRNIPTGKTELVIRRLCERFEELAERYQPVSQ